MKSYVKLLTTVALVTASLIAPAMARANNIRVIGKGGGGAEMEALTFFDQIPDLIEFCARENGNPCGLEDSEIRTLEVALAAPTRFPKRLSFKSELESFRMTADQTMELSAQNLTKSLLLTFVVNAALGTNDGTQADWQGSGFKERTAKSILKNRKINLEALALKRFSGERTTPQLVTVHGEFGASVFIKTENGRSVLTWDLLEAVGCSLDAKLLSIEDVRKEGNGFLATAIWTCSGHEWSANLVAQRYEDAVGGRFLIRAYAKEQLACGSWLK